MTINELICEIISTDICWNCSECYGDGICKHKVSTDMTVLSIIMIKGGDF